MKKWYKLDNAAKIFPSVSSKKRSNVFRLSFNLTEEVDAKVLQEALNYTLTRFRSFKVKLKKGLFWYYFDENTDKINVFEESPFICQPFKRRDNNGYLFKVSYFQKRITLEMFHSLTDGTGALEFLKSLVFNYLIFKGYELESENLILTDIEHLNEESQDSFVKNYDRRIKASPRDKKALQLKGTPYEENWLSLIMGEVDVMELKNVAKKYNATITEFISACIIYSAIKTPYLFEHKKKPIQLFVPVNLRNFFPSKTLRNFSLFIATGAEISNKITFEDVIEIVKTDFTNELQKDRLQARIVANVMIEKNFLMRIVPLIIKEIVLKLGYNAWGDSINSLTYSNLGKVNLPKSMEPFIDNVVFINGASFTSPINIGSISYKNKLVIAFPSVIIERDIQREFFRLLANFGLNVTIETNELEVLS